MAQSNCPGCQWCVSEEFCPSGEHSWQAGGNSGIDLCSRCPAGRTAGRIYEAQSEPPWGY